MNTHQLTEQLEIIIKLISTFSSRSIQDVPFSANSSCQSDPSRLSTLIFGMGRNLGGCREEDRLWGKVYFVSLQRQTRL